MAHETSPGGPNRLAHESSPYLLHHAHNPVDWYPWGPEALQRAKAEGRPILLSIGYSACWWCRVMAQESFEDPGTAALMNDLFVNVKVDREERPDLDRIYQLAHQVLTRRSGGWPLTMFLSPEDQRPFFGGTYFPKEARHGMPAFRDILQRVAHYWREQAPAVREQNAALMQVFDDIVPPPAGAGEPLDAGPLAACRQELQDDFDAQWGGFGTAPKFPHPATLARLLRDWHATAARTEPDLHALYMASLTLRRMGEGGLFDQLGGGFFRYSTDPYWMIPHFEKMLYDNGALLAVYAQAAVATGDAFYARIAGRTADWLLRDMQAPEGGFCSSWDAASEGHEGRYYAWDADELRRSLAPAAYEAFARRFGLDGEPNFEGRWHLHAHQSVEAIAEGTGRKPGDVDTLLDLARGTLLAVRAKRVAPERDAKVLAGWNALAIRGLAIAARALQRPDLEAAATRAVDFARSRLWRDGRLLAVAKDGHAHLDAYLDDHAFLADALLELLQVRWRAEDLAFAIDLVEAMLARFEDAERGGFYFTGADAEPLIHRPKSFADEATPSGNGVAAFVLQRLGWLLGETRYLAAAERTLRAGWKSMQDHPQAHATLLGALEEHLSPPEILVLRGEAGEIGRWQRELDRLWAPRRVMVAIPADAAGLPPALASKAALGNAVAYVCRGPTCSAPIDTLAALVRDLRLRLEPG